MKVIKTKPAFYRSQILLTILACLTQNAYSQNDGHADENWLHVKPGQCVALHQGQECYQTLLFTWQVNSADEYCLIQERLRTPVVCWRGSERTAHQLAFRDNQQTQFDLQIKASGESVADVMVDVAWVYKQRKRRSGWRLF